MATKVRTGASKGQIKRSHTRSGLASNSRGTKAVKAAAKPTQQKPKPSAATSTKKKPPHMRYTEQELNVPQLNGIRPTGIRKPPNAKKGKKFVDDPEQLNTILALVMAEKEGNIESKIMRARQLEEVREARRVEAEKRAESKKAGLEERKQEIKDKKKHSKRRYGGYDTGIEDAEENVNSKKPMKAKKRVSFG